MHWISPANYATHSDFLKHLAAGGIGELLLVIGTIVPNVWTLICCQLSFIVVSTCKDSLFHTDFSNTGGRTWNIMIPLVLVKRSPAELILKHSSNGTVIPVKYEVGAGVILGNGDIHCTAPIPYQEGQY